MKKYDSIIIGAGMSGLAAGIRLAHYGQKVCICERHSRIGGLNSWYSRNGMILETGLHAMTNYARRGDPKSLPLMKLLRQLRIPLDRLASREQHYSMIRFPDKTLFFDNNFERFSESIAQNFPKEIDNFKRLDAYLETFDEVNLTNRFTSARRQLERFINDPLLTDMLLCPLFYYGSAVEDDMDFSQFAIMYKSIYKQGFFRPGGGIKAWLDILCERFLESGGELHLNCGIDKIIIHDNHAKGVITSGGKEILSDRILSSAGWRETEALAGVTQTARLGNLAFFELLAAFNSLPEHNETIVFFCNSERLSYRRPKDIVDLNSGVICFPHNFKLEDGDFIPSPMVRTTVLADYSTCANHKAEAVSQVSTLTANLTGIDMSQANFTDAFTPRTIERYTGHLNGAIYGSPDKLRSGKTSVEGLFLCGTDQGFLGITGATLSGISMANLYMLLS